MWTLYPQFFFQKSVHNNEVQPAGPIFTRLYVVFHRRSQSFLCESGSRVFACVRVRYFMS